MAIDFVQFLCQKFIFQSCIIYQTSIFPYQNIQMHLTKGRLKQCSETIHFFSRRNQHHDHNDHEKSPVYTQCQKFCLKINSVKLFLIQLNLNMFNFQLDLCTLRTHAILLVTQRKPYDDRIRAFCKQNILQCEPQMICL